MAIPKFPLKMNDGSEARTLEELREHADLTTIVAQYESGALLRWLKAWGYIEEAAKTEHLDSKAEDVYVTLYDVLGIPWTEETDAQFTQCVDAINDRIALQLNDSNDSFEFVETDDYILLNSDSTGKLEKWVILSKKKGRDMTFMLPEEDMDRLPKTSRKPNRDPFDAIGAFFHDLCEPLFLSFGQRTSEMHACGNRIVWADNKHLFALDLEEWKVKEVISLTETTFSDLITDGIDNRIAYGLDLSEDEWGDNTGALCLYNLKDGTSREITADGEAIKASGAVLTENTLFFVCENSELFLDDGKDPVNCVCRYDFDTGRSKVLANIKINDFLPNILRFSDDRLYICGKHEEEYYYCSISADVPTETVQFECLTDELRARNYMTDSEKFCGKGLFSFKDGFVFLGGSEDRIYLCFLDFASGEKKFSLLAAREETAVEIAPSSCFRLGNWFYYSIRFNSSTHSRERWKISLKTGEQKQLSGESQKEEKS